MKFSGKFTYILVIVIVLIISTISIVYFETSNKSPNTTTTPTANPTLSPTNNPSATPSAQLGLLISNTPFVGEGSMGNGWNSTIKIHLTNIGNASSIITDFVINGKSYKDYTPQAIVDPPIENGYTVAVHQAVDFTIKLYNQPSPLYQGANEMYVITKDGQSLRIFLGS